LSVERLPVATSNTAGIVNSGSQTFSGAKTFTDTLHVPSVISTGTLYLRSDAVKGSTPISSTGRHIDFNESTGTDAANRLAMIYGYTNSSGDNVLGLYSYKPTASSIDEISLDIHYPKSGDSYATFNGGYL
jgi:hypothetical protein